MDYIDLHAHMVSRTTDDYQQMALTGCVAISEPAFWPGWDRTSAAGFEAAVGLCGAVLADHFPPRPSNPNEVADRLVVI